MPKMRIGDIEVSANTVKQTFLLFDKAIQYAKILQTEASAMLSCPVCHSYDIEPVSPFVNRCRVCDTEIQYIDEG